MFTVNEEQTRSYNPILATKPIEGVSKNYGFVSSEELIRHAASHGFEVVKTTYGRVNKKEREGFQRHCITMRHPNLKTNDGDFVQLYIINSHDRSAAVSIHLGIFRLVCENGLVVGDSTFSAKVFHTGRDLAARIHSAFAAALFEAPRIVAAQARLKSITLGPTERDMLAYRCLARLGIDRLQDTSALNLPQRAEDQACDLWTCLNVIQERLVDGSYRRLNGSGTRFVKARPIKSVQRNIETNKVLFDVALEFANELQGVAACI